MTSPGGGGPGGGAPDDGSPAGGDDDYPGDWPSEDDGSGDGEFGSRPGDGPTPEDPGGDPGNWHPPDPPDPPGDVGDADGSDYRPCPACRGAGGGIGLPVKANLTIPAGALDWLAEWSAGNAGNAARDPAGNGPTG